MKFLNNLWPWKELNRLNEEVEFLKRTLEHEQTSHNITRASLQDHKLELIDHKSRNVQSQKDIRKLATILAVRGGISLILFFFSLSAVGQPLQRNPVTTNLLANGPSTSYFLGWDGSKPAWTVPLDGLGTNLWLTNASFIFPIPHLAASNDLGWWNAGGDVSLNATNNDKLFGLNATNEVARMGTSITNGAILNLSNLVSTISQNATNQGTVVSNGVVAHTVTVAGTANQITSSVGTAQTIAANPATTLSLPDPLIAPGVFSANGQTNRAFAAIGVVTNDANGKLYTTPTLPNALLGNSSLTIAGTASQIAVAGGGPVSLGGTATLSIPTAPQVTNLFNSGDQYRTNGSTSTTSYDLIASNALGSVSVVSGLITATSTSGAAFKSPTNTPAVGQQLNVTSTAGDTAYQNPHYLSTILGGQYVWTGVVNSQARYCPPNGFQSSATTATEASTSIAFPAGTLTNLYVRLVSLGSSTNMTVTVMVNNSASNLAVSINGNGSTQTSVDTTHSATVTDQQAVDIRIVANCPTAPSGSVLLYWSLQFAQ